MSRNNFRNKNNQGMINQAGRNIYNIETIPENTSKSRIYSVCILILNADTSEYNAQKLTQPSSWDDKFNHNNVDTYQEIFKKSSINYQKTQEIFQSMPNSDKIVSNINTIYNRLKIKFLNDYKIDQINEKHRAGDLILLEMFDEVKSMIENDYYYLDNLPDDSFYIEDYEDAINSVLFFVFTQCELLEELP